jgi:hypothetical protein
MLALLIPGVGMGGGEAAVPVEVPDVVGELEAVGTTDLENAGFVVSSSTAYSDSVVAGLIISQDPVGGSFANPGSTVDIVVSLGPQPVETEPVGGHYWPGHAKKKPRDYRAEIDEEQLQNRSDLRRSLERAAGLIDEAAEVASEPEVIAAVEGAREELQQLTRISEPAAADTREFEAAEIKAAVDQLISRAVDQLIERIEVILKELIAEIQEDERPK